MRLEGWPQAMSGQATVEAVALATTLAIAGLASLGLVRARAGTVPVRHALVAAGRAAPFVRGPAVAPGGDPSTLGVPPGSPPLVWAQRLAALGIVERPEGSQRGPWVDAFTDGHPEQWCADFASWVLWAGGRPFSGGLSGGWRIPGVAAVFAWFERRGRYVDAARARPQPGDLVRFDRGDGHVGIVESLTGDVLHTIEGNSANAVARRTYPGWRAWDIAGFGRP